MPNIESVSRFQTSVDHRARFSKRFGVWVEEQYGLWDCYAYFKTKTKTCYLHFIGITKRLALALGSKVKK